MMTALNFLVRGDPILLFILTVMSVILGLYTVRMYRARFKADQQSKTWPTTTGKITSSRIDEFMGRAKTATGSRRTIYTPQIKFSYTVDGKQYHGDRIGNGDYQSYTEYSPNRLIKRYPAQSEVTIYYNPADPTDALLQPTAAGNLIGLIVGTIISLFGVICIAIVVYRLVTGR